MTDSIGGYEWGWNCGECEEFNDLRGCGWGQKVIVNGEEYSRVNKIESGDTLECRECGHTITISIEASEE